MVVQCREGPGGEVEPLVIEEHTQRRARLPVCIQQIWTHAGMNCDQGFQGLIHRDGGITEAQVYDWPRGDHAHRSMKGNVDLHPYSLELVLLANVGANAERVETKRFNRQPFA
jgi:hypothetical protein